MYALRPSVRVDGVRGAAACSTFAEVISTDKVEATPAART
jgi:hypothetical protein